MKTTVNLAKKALNSKALFLVAVATILSLGKINASSLNQKSERNAQVGEINLKELLKETKELEIKFESWMVDLSSFRKVNNTPYVNNDAEEAEIEVEPWMTNLNLFKDKNNTEEGIEIESWMLDPDEFSNSCKLASY